MIVILLNGHPKCGKDTFIEIAQDTYKVYQHSTINRCRTFATMMGWNGIKDDKSRAMLSDLKKFYTTYFDGPMKDIVSSIKSVNNKEYYDFFITVSREGKEIQRIRKWCESNNIKFYYIFIDRGNKRDFGNNSDNNVLENCDPDFYLSNKGDVKEYIHTVNLLLDVLLNK